MKNRINIFVLIGIIFLCLMVWLEGESQDKRETSTTKCYGGSLPEKMKSHFEMMNNDIKYMKRIVYAQSNRILFKNQYNQMVEYHYAHQALWRNQVPIVFDVQSFNFEYRNEAGNLFTQIYKYLDLIETIGYTARITLKERDILSNCKIALSSLKNDNALSNGNQVALAIPESHLLQ